MSRNQFSVTTNYKGLEEAIEAVLHNSDDEAEYDLAIIPPDPSVVTDEEEGEEENFATGSMPRDVPGNIEVFTNAREVDSSDSDSSYVEPLAAKRVRLQPQQQTPVWRKCPPNYCSTSQSTTEVEDRLNAAKEELKSLKPVQIFEKLFDEEVIDLIVSNSVLYANQNNRHSFEVDAVEMKKFIGILILSGYHKLPREAMYWSVDEDVSVSLVSNAMARNRFRDIKRNLHLVNNDDASNTTDKMFKVRALGDILMKKFNQWGVLHEKISIDESMVKYFGLHPAKQFIRGKPVRFGYKNWVAASSSGYCYTFDFYCGKQPGPNPTEPLGSRVVKSLLNKLGTNPANHQVFFDNFFTNYDLLVDLRKLGYRATGTVRENRTKRCPMKSTKEMKKESRAAFDYRFDKNNEVLLVRWKDNSVCTMATNFDTIEPMGVVKRWCPIKREKADVDIPRLFQTYNRSMGGVDELDQSISLYRIAVHGKKWWWVLFTYMIDMTIANAWRLHVLSSDETMDQLLFRRNIARFYLRQDIQKKTRVSSSLVPGLPQDGTGHYPKKLEKQLRCVLCHARVRWQCKKCLKTLCIEKPCFEQFHL